MTEEEVLTPEEDLRKRQGDAISGGIFLISLGVLLFTGWWWPGIMVAIGLASGAGLIFRGRFWSGILTMAFFLAIPLGIWIIQETDISWSLVGAWILIGMGVIVIAKAFFFQDR